jgi:hypothetical protein
MTTLVDEWKTPEPAEISHPTQRERDQRISQREQLIRAGADCEFFHTSDHRVFACVPVNGHTETIAIKSRVFRALLLTRFYQGTGKAPHSRAIEEAVAYFEGQALCSHQLAVHTRLAAYKGAVYLDLGNETWQGVEVTSDGWRVTAELPVKFRRPRGMLALPTPTEGGSVSDLRPFVNVRDDDDFVLLVAWLLAALRPDLPVPVQVLHGEQGSAKSTTAKVQRKLIDPAKAPLRSLPRDERDLFIAATNSLVVAIDNVSGLLAWLSDALCRLSTGGGFATRELYSDDDERIFSALRPIILNGIEEVAARSDLLDRCILLELPTISKESLRVEADFWREFEEARPRILGALLDAVACGLRNLPTTRLKSCPRMADFATWIVSCEPALGWESGTFLRSYERNRGEANQVSLDGSPIGAAVQEIARIETKWTGSATDLLQKINEMSDQRAQRQGGWPQNGKAVSGQLKRIAPNLRAQGVMVNWLPRTAKVRQIQILWTDVQDSVISVTASSNGEEE